jgi:2-dehydro-3-deoxyglucarate aldolase/4-hydroxy-2-oxoheptanedioate aldolase
VDRVIAACARNGKAAGFMVADVEGARTALQQGFRALAYWGDVWLYQSALRQGLDAVRGLIADSGPRQEVRGS